MTMSAEKNDEYGRAAVQIKTTIIAERADDDPADHDHDQDLNRWNRNRSD